MIGENASAKQSVAGSIGLSRLKWAAGPWSRLSVPAVVVAIVLLVALPWLAGLTPIRNFVLHLMILFFLWGIVTQGWNLIMGVSGIFSFAQVALFAVGAWTSGVMVQQLGWSPFVTMWVGAVATTVVALILGYHHACWKLLGKFARHANTRSHVWYRWFNEVPVVLLLIAVVLVVVKPF